MFKSRIRPSLAPSTINRLREQARASTSSLSSFQFIDSVEHDLSERQRSDLRALSLALVCGAVRHTDIPSYCDEFGIIEAVQKAARPGWLSKPVRADTNFLVHGKPYALAHIAKFATDRADRLALTTHDRRLIAQATAHPVFSDKFQRILDDYSAFVMPTPSLRSLIGSVATSTSLKRFIHFFTFKKLRFLDNHLNVAKTPDLEAELLEEAIRALYKRYPSFYSELHMINVAKAAARNHGQNLIKAYMSEKRNIVATQGDRNHVLVRNQSAYMSGDFEGNEMPYVEGLGTNNLMTPDTTVYDRITHNPTSIDLDRWERKRTLDRAVQVLNLTDARSGRYLALLRGERNPTFSDYLGERSDEFADRVPFPTLQAKASAFLEITAEESASVLRTVQRLFAEH